MILSTRPGNGRPNCTFLKLLHGDANVLLRGRDIRVSPRLFFWQRFRLYEILVITRALVICFERLS